MTVFTSYPGVYVTEIPSGVRTISGVATSITAFIGRTRRGPVNQATVVSGYADYEQIFGGLWQGSTVSFAVRDFFANGGGQAVVVRLVSKEAVAPAARTTAAPAVLGRSPLPLTPLDPPKTKASASGSAKPTASEAAATTEADLHLSAAEPGSWGNGLIALVDYNTPPGAATEVAAQLGVVATNLFNLVVTYLDTGETEVHRNVTVVDSARRVDTVLETESRLVRATVDPDQTKRPLPRPAETGSGRFQMLQPGTDGEPLLPVEYVGDGLAAKHQGLWALDHVDLFNLLCIPPPTVNGISTDSFDAVNTHAGVYHSAMTYCVSRRAVLIVDAPSGMTAGNAVVIGGVKPGVLDGLKLTGEAARNVALYFPRLRQPDPTDQGRLGTFVGCGAVAGVIARTDATRGVWKAPAGLDAALTGIAGLAVNLTDAENGTLNALGVDCLRTFPGVGTIVWGARTLRGSDHLGDEYKYLPVRRLALHIEESLFRGTQWVVFEPNDEPLWAQIRLNLGAFMHDLFRQGAFQGTTARDAYFVKCDRETTTSSDVNSGRVNILVGFAPVRPAEFVVLQIQQIAQAQA
jgi:phage tail sheath protein FI